ncbi:hypothetical protein [Cyprinid herpesvirus 2]|nr:hypothetical protein [Cyprinid herpesvirus 2]
MSAAALPDRHVVVVQPGTLRSRVHGVLSVGHSAFAEVETGWRLEIRRIPHHQCLSTLSSPPFYVARLHVVASRGYGLGTVGLKIHPHGAHARSALDVHSVFYKQGLAKATRCHQSNVRPLGRQLRDAVLGEPKITRFDVGRVFSAGPHVRHGPRVDVLDSPLQRQHQFHETGRSRGLGFPLGIGGLSEVLAAERLARLYVGGIIGVGALYSGVAQVPVPSISQSFRPPSHLRGSSSFLFCCY